MKHFTGYCFLQGPEQLLLEPGRRVTSREEYLAWHISAVTFRGGNVWDSPEQVKTYINHGRWVADCFWCKNGMLTRPDWRLACCSECGARYHLGRIVYPKNYKAIEKILLRRVRRDQQNWDDRQSVGELEKENKLPEVLTP